MAKVDMRGRAAKNTDDYFILDRDQNFYPNPGQHFFKSRVKVSLPATLNCLASGSLSSRRKYGERNEFIFESPGSKGISLVCGNFEKLATVPGPLPIQVYGNPKLSLRDSFSAAAIKGYVDFLVDKFGTLDMPELNLLLRRWQNYGGWSHQGFVIFNLLGSNIIDDDVSMVRRLRSESPVVFTDVNRDNLVHELAHQWWGGRRFLEILPGPVADRGTGAVLHPALPGEHAGSETRSARWWPAPSAGCSASNDAGPIIYGRRIANLSADLETSRASSTTSRRWFS